MRVLILASCLAIAGVVDAADPPVKKEEPACAILTFSDPRQSPKSYSLTLELRTASGSIYELPIFVNDTNGYRETQRALLDANWMADPSWKVSAIRIYGVRTKDGKADAVQSLTLTNRRVDGEGQLPKLSAAAGVKVETKEDDGKEKKPAKPGERRKGPEFGNEPFIEYDFSTLPDVKGVYWDFTLKAQAGSDPKPWVLDFTIASEGVHDGSMCKLIAAQMNDAGVKALRVDKKKIRVYGWVDKDRFLPASKGSIESKDLPKEQLPAVIQPKVGG